MLANSSPMSVADYCQDFNARKIIINEDYQRNVGLWTTQARSYFIESILLGFPIPKIYLHARLDLRIRQTIKEVVDGQQRTNALQLFYNGKLRLASNIDTKELQGKNYGTLSEEWQSKFLSYSLPIDQFSGATDPEIREAFRRMNANNVPLNDEEQRNAMFQGEFKWFITPLADEYEERISAVGVFSRRDLLRMADLKFYSEIILAIDQGFITVKGKQIDDLYRKYNAAFTKKLEYRAILTRGLDRFIENEALHTSTFKKTHVTQSLVLALATIDEFATIEIHLDEKQRKKVQMIAGIGANIEALDESVRDPAAYPQLSEFVEACSKKTNVGEFKFLRYAYLRAALLR